MEPLLLRADASAEMGTGHVMRCLALAQAWTAWGGEAVLGSAAPLPEGLAARLRAERVAHHVLDVEPGSAADLDATVALARKAGARSVVLDGYHFGTAAQRALHRAGIRVACIDDYGHAGRYDADVVANPNLSADPAMYRDRDASTRLLLGPRYAMLRREFWPFRGQPRATRAEADRVLVTCGGGDAADLTGRVLRALEGVPQKLRVTVVLGAANARAAAIEKTASASRHAITLVRDTDRMPQLMAEADVAIAASGSTCWELCFMGLPSFLIATADNQQPLASSIAARGAALDLGWHGDLDAGALASAVTALLRDPEPRARMAAAGQALVDGEGPDRVCAAIAGWPLRLRRATPSDAARYWAWANEEEVRSASFTQEPIPWERHMRWFEARLEDPATTLFVAVDDDDIPLGQVRFQRRGDRAEVSLSVDASSRGKGLGTAMIRQGVARLRATGWAVAFDAYVKPENPRSARAFEAAGFAAAAPAEKAGQRSLHLVFPAPPR